MFTFGQKYDILPGYQVQIVKGPKGPMVRNDNMAEILLWKEILLLGGKNLYKKVTDMFYLRRNQNKNQKKRVTD